MADFHKMIRSKWCAVLMALLAAMGFGACHRAQKVVIIDDNNQITDSSQITNPPVIRDPGEIIALYGVPPSKYKKIERQEIKPQND